MYSAAQLRASDSWVVPNVVEDPATDLEIRPAGFYNATLDRYEKLGTYTALLSSTIVNSKVTVGQLDCYCGDFELESTEVTNGYSVRCMHATFALRTITFNANDGSESTTTQTMQQGVSTALPANTFTREHYTFAGWSTTATGAVEYEDGASYTATADDTLYAVWNKFYTITFNANNGTGSTTTQLIAQNSTANLTANSFTRPDYEFAGWSTTATGSVEYADGAEYTATEDDTLYAVWRVPIEMVFVAGGTFNMGAAATDTEADTDERPVHSVTLSSYYIGKYEVTQAQWEAVMDENPSGFQAGPDAPSRPVEQITWYDAVTFCNELSIDSNLTPYYNIINETEVTVNPDANGYRLPTEAEWEYAARGGALSESYLFSGSSNIDEVAWYISNSESKTQPVGEKQANELGIYDMSGNVWEWCWDRYGNYEGDAQTNPVGATSGLYRVRRGGGDYSNAGSCRSTNRNRSTPTYSNDILGLRLVRAVPAPSYTVTFDANNGTGSTTTQQIEQDSTAALTPNTFTRADYEFAGWSTTATGTVEYRDGVEYTATADDTLYAVWNKLCTITFNANNGTGSTTTQQIEQDSTANLTANTFTRTDSTFAGWSTTAGGAVEYNNKAPYTATANATLYAVWVPEIEGMVYVAGGTFNMGAAATDTEADTDERPVHSVTLSSYYIGKYEVTQAQWEAVMDENPSGFQAGPDAPSRPVEQITWYDAVTFCNELSIDSNLTPYYNIINETEVTVNPDANGYRLPTEAEWEYAARGGALSESYLFSGSSNIDEVAWYISNSESKTQPVGEKQANELGIYDMSGNVWEWCWDRYGNYEGDAQTNPVGATSGLYRVYRGGSFYNYAWYCRSTYRNFSMPAFSNRSLGLRLVRRP